MSHESSGVLLSDVDVPCRVMVRRAARLVSRSFLRQQYILSVVGAPVGRISAPQIGSQR